MIKEISYGIIPVRDGKVLLLRSYHIWDFPKGKPNPSESHINTAVRELREETSLESPLFIWGLDHVESMPYKKGKKIAVYFIASCPFGEVQLLPNPESGIVEHHEFAWFSLENAKRLVGDRLQPVMSWIEERLSYVAQRAY
jgi:8-oxo-dGTP pyrophosphatase MutT (NUDIX family)